MAVSVAGSTNFAAHYVVLYRRIEATNQYPQVMIIYMDGNVRLKPQAPIGTLDTCFGSSVLIGPSDPNVTRPVAEIASLSYKSTAERFDVKYRDGSTAMLTIRMVDRAQTAIHVDIGYPVSDKAPAVIFRSMYVADGNADIDHIQSAAGTTSILNFSEDTGQSFNFIRAVRSAHNTSAPDIKISVTY
jgi:hypothetical protein